MNYIQMIKETGVVPVIRGATVDNIVSIAKALKDGGVNVSEITVETPGACDAIKKVSKEVEGVLVGGDLIKLFPANAFGPSFIKDIHGPLPQIPIISTGGISLENVNDYIKAGAVGVGVGSSLVNTKKELTTDYLNEITETASMFVNAVKEARG
jgi:2-keto-3-deoxy-6-phosphogluconate aldolase